MGRHRPPGGYQAFLPESVLLMATLAIGERSWKCLKTALDAAKCQVWNAGSTVGLKRAPIIYRATGNLRAVQTLLGHSAGTKPPLTALASRSASRQNQPRRVSHQESLQMLAPKSPVSQLNRRHVDGVEPISSPKVRVKCA